MAKGDISGIWIDEAQHFKPETVERFRSMKGDGSSYFMLDGELAEVTLKDTSVACATAISSHGGDDLPLDPRKTAD